MTKIITTTELQRNIGDIAEMTKNNSVIVTNNGKGRYVILPYFDDNSEAIEDYIENFEMSQNKEVLEKRYQESIQSGLSDIVV